MLFRSYGPLVTGTGNSFTKTKGCSQCPAGYDNDALDDPAGAVTTCDFIPCAANHHILNGACTQCPANTTNAAGDDTSGSETYCDISTPCAQNHFVDSNYQCEACSAGTYNDPGDNTIGTCDDTEKCLADQHVKVSYPSDNTKKYGGSACSGESDCQSKCTANSTCVGYSTSKTRPLGAGQYHMCYLVDDGTVKCLGKNQYGQLGSGSTTAQSGFSTPSLGKSAIAVDAASAHSCALLVDKTIKCWGVNGLRQLGDGSTTDRSSPVTVSGYKIGRAHV